MRSCWEASSGRSPPASPSCASPRLSRPFLRAIDVVAHRRLEVDLDDRLRVRRDHPLTAAIALQPQQIGEEAPIEDRWVPSMVAVARDDDPPWRKCTDQLGNRLRVEL